MQNSLNEIKKKLVALRTPEAAAAFKKFVPGSMNIYGVRTSLLDNLSKQYKNEGFDLVKELWQSGWFEEQILAVKILQKIAKKDPELSLQLVAAFAPQINNWAVCDALGMQALQSIRTTHQNEIFALAKKYNGSTNFWERRLSLVLVEYYTRDASLHNDINKLVTQLENDDEYYVKKAVVWIKKNFAKAK